MKNKLNSIQFKLLISVALIILFSFIFLGYNNYKASQKAMLNRIIKFELPYYSDKAELTISQIISEGIHNLDIMDNDSYFIDLISNPQNRYDEINKYLKLRTDNNDNLQIGFVSKADNSYYNINGNTGKLNKKNSAWYFNFLKKNEDREFSVDKDLDTKEVKLWVEQKVYDSKGKILGVAYVGYNLNKIKKFIKSQNFGNTGESMMVGMDGIIKIHSKMSKTSIFDTSKTDYKFSSITGIGKKASKIIKNRDTSMTYKDANGKNRILISRYIPQLNWVMIIDASENKILKPIRKNFIKNLFGGIIITIIIIFLIIILINHIAIKPINKISKYIASFASGYLNTEVDIHSKDELGKLASELREMQKKLSEIAKKITKSSETISQTGSEIKNNAQRLASGASEQAASIEEVSASMEQILFKVKQNMQHSENTKEISEKSYQELEHVFQSVEETSKTMLEITKKVSIISEIAAKTDILAINAAIEAARAGDAGQGFAVVASEIRKLAENSKKAAIEIAQNSEKSVDVANRSISLLKEVMPDIEKTSKLVNLITEATIEQEQSIDGVNQAINQLSQISYENSSDAEELASSSEIFDIQSKELNTNISFFKFKKK